MFRKKTKWNLRAFKLDMINGNYQAQPSKLISQNCFVASQTPFFVLEKISHNFLCIWKIYSSSARKKYENAF